MKKRKKPEEKIQIAVSLYLQTNYPDTDFISEQSGLSLSSWGQINTLKATRSKMKLPDLTILEPVHPYAGLVIEIKADGESPYKADGSLKSNKHTKDQAETLYRLRKKGYFAEFGVGYADCIRIIEDYMDLAK